MLGIGSKLCTLLKVILVVKLDFLKKLFWLQRLGNHALDLAARGSFKLLPPSEASQVMVNLFGTYYEEKDSKILKNHYGDFS
jgi:hypothetical protein